MMRAPAALMLTLGLASGVAFAKPRDTLGRTAMTTCLDALRTRLVEQLRSEAHFYLEGRVPMSLAAIARDLASASPPDHQSVLAVTLLPDRRAATGLLESFLSARRAARVRASAKGLNEGLHELAELDAAVLLALEGSRSGLPLLLDFRGGTSSNIECFYAKAGLLLLGVPIPAPLAARRSVFTDLERLIDDCLPRPPAPP